MRYALVICAAVVVAQILATHYGFVHPLTGGTP